MLKTQSRGAVGYFKLSRIFSRVKKGTKYVCGMIAEMRRILYPVSYHPAWTTGMYTRIRDTCHTLFVDTRTRVVGTNLLTPSYVSPSMIRRVSCVLYPRPVLVYCTTILCLACILHPLSCILSHKYPVPGMVYLIYARCSTPVCIPSTRPLGSRVKKKLTPPSPNKGAAL